MVQNQDTPDRVVDLETRWRRELDALHAAGDAAGLDRVRADHALSASHLLAQGSILAADVFAGLVAHADALLDEDRVVRRPPSVEDPGGEGDWQLKERNQ